MDGVIVVNKPLGKTSHDMVGIIRRLSGIRRVGHTGTLDPMATGVLPVCIGKATKAADMLTFSDKKYHAQMILGMTTDTQDAEGQVLTECPVTCTQEQIQNVVKQFIGEIKQVPPMYSAVKQNGKKLYELARAGIEVERKKRTVTIHRIDIAQIDLQQGSVTMDVECSKGTYIRVLCEDIGLALGCGAYMNRLERRESAGFSIEESHTVEELCRRAEEGTLSQILVPTDKLFERYPRLTVDSRQEKQIKNGVQIRFRGLVEEKSYRVYNEAEEFLAIAAPYGERLKLVKTFWS